MTLNELWVQIPKQYRDLPLELYMISRDGLDDGAYTLKIWEINKDKNGNIISILFRES